MDPNLNAEVEAQLRRLLAAKAATFLEQGVEVTDAQVAGWEAFYRPRLARQFAFVAELAQIARELGEADPRPGAASAFQRAYTTLSAGLAPAAMVEPLEAETYRPWLIRAAEDALRGEPPAV